MATREWVEMIDDLDGSTKDVQTVRFSVGDETYEIELSAKNRAAFEKAIAPYVKAGRLSVSAWVARRAGGSTKKQRKAPKAKDVVISIDTAAVRAWAAENGIEVSQRGRIASSVLQQYQAATA